MKLWTQESYLTLPCCQGEWFISGFILSRGLGPSRGFEGKPVLREDKADRDTVTCVSVVRVGMDGARSAIEQLPAGSQGDGIGITRF